jgi:hypothetical protein
MKVTEVVCLDFVEQGRGVGDGFGPGFELGQIQGPGVGVVLQDAGGVKRFIGRGGGRRGGGCWIGGLVDYWAWLGTLLRPGSLSVGRALRAGRRPGQD